MPERAEGRDGVMRHGRDCWDIVPVRLVLGSLAAAGVCAGIGLYVPPFNALAVVLYGTMAVGLMLYGLFGSLAATFKEGVWHGIACLLLPAVYPIYFHATHPGSGWKPFVNMVLGFGLIWVAVQVFPMFRQADAKPARPLLAGGDPLERIGPSRNDPDPPGAGPLTATTDALARLLVGVTDESSARKAAPRYRQLMAQRRSDFEAAGEPRALDDRGVLVSISAVIKLGPRFRDANRAFEVQWKRVRRNGGLSAILEGTR
jgi:hypothetical protein